MILKKHRQYFEDLKSSLNCEIRKDRARKNPGVWRVSNHGPLKQRILRNQRSSTELAGPGLLISYR